MERHGSEDRKALDAMYNAGTDSVHTRLTSGMETAFPRDGSDFYRRSTRARPGT